MVNEITRYIMEKLGYLKKVDKSNDLKNNDLYYEQLARDHRIYKTGMSIGIGILVILLIAANICFVAAGLWQDPKFCKGVLLTNIGMVGMIGVIFLMRND